MSKFSKSICTIKDAYASFVAELCLAFGRYPSAIEWYRRVVATRFSYRGPNSRESILAQISLARLLATGTVEQEGECTEILANVRGKLAARDGQGVGSTDLARVLIVEGYLAKRNGHFGDAVQFLQQSHIMFVASFTPVCPEHAEALELLAQAYFAVGKRSEAVSARQRAEGILSVYMSRRVSRRYR